MHPQIAASIASVFPHWQHVCRNMFLSATDAASLASRKCTSIRIECHILQCLANRPGVCHDKSSCRASIPALLAQLAEQLTLNQRVSGSSPEGGISASVYGIPKPSDSTTLRLGLDLIAQPACLLVVFPLDGYGELLA